MTQSDVRPQQARENPEPSEAPNPMPWFVLLLTAALLGFGIAYISRASLDEAPELGDGRTLAELRGPAAAPAGAGIDGAAVYAARCAACHQAGGTGLPGAFPPLAGAEWVTGKAETLVAIVIHGIAGPLTVKGATYNGAMPAFGVQLQDAEIAAVLTHIRGQWGNQAAPIDTPTVAAVRKDTAGRTEPFKGDAELAAPE